MANRSIPLSGEQQRGHALVKVRATTRARDGATTEKSSANRGKQISGCSPQVAKDPGSEDVARTATQRGCPRYGDEEIKGDDERITIDTNSGGNCHTPVMFIS